MRDDCIMTVIVNVNPVARPPSFFVHNDELPKQNLHYTSYRAATALL